MRFTRKLGVTVAATAALVGAVPALASAAPPPPPTIWGDQACPPGQIMTWVDREGTPPRLIIDELGRIKLIPGDPPFHGWTCQPYKLRPYEN
jgi:hypothetical protein